MFVRKRLLIACTLITAIYHFPVYSSLEYKGAFGSVNAGYTDWNNRSVNTHRGKVWKMAADFGVGFKEAGFYSFYKSNVFNHAVAGRNHTVSVMTRVRLFGSDTTFPDKIYGRQGDSQGDDLDMLYGFGYLGWNDGWGFFEPYIGLHNQPGDYVSAKYGQTNGWNGYVVGWTVVLPSTLLDEKPVLSNWNEIELDRNGVHTEQQFGRNGLNDGLTIAWELYPRQKVGVAWRYFDNRLGYDSSGDQIIYMLGYDF